MNTMLSSVLHVQISLGTDLLQPRAEYVSPLLAATILISYPKAKMYDPTPSPTFLFLSFPSSFHYRKWKGNIVRTFLPADTAATPMGMEIQNKVSGFSVFYVSCKFQSRVTITPVRISRFKAELTCWCFQVWLIFLIYMDCLWFCKLP